MLEEKSGHPGDVVACYVQKEPAHKLVNLTKIPVLYLSAARAAITACPTNAWPSGSIRPA